MATPVCPYFGVCGGCATQHIDYTQQIEQKKAYIERLIGHPVSVHTGEQYNYRNRMDFIFFSGGLGLRSKHNDIVPVESCSIADPRIVALLAEVKQFFAHVDAFDTNKRSGTYRSCIIRAVKDTSISFVLNNRSTTLSAAIDRITSFASKSAADHILVTYVDAQSEDVTSGEFFAIKGNGTLSAELAGMSYGFSAQGFFQNNLTMASRMQEYCHELFSKYPTKQSNLLDLYAGVGTFGIKNAPLFKTVTMIEAFPAADITAQNMLRNGVNNGKALTLDAVKLRKIQLGTPLYVLTDPPRSGMDKRAILQLADMKPEVIIYISCNVQEFAKELHLFKGYMIKSAALFDLFPQTHHTEVVVELVKA